MLKLYLIRLSLAAEAALSMARARDVGMRKNGQYEHVRRMGMVQLRLGDAALSADHILRELGMGAA